MQHINFKKILVPTDFSETAKISLEHVKWLASTFSSEVTLLHVGEITPAANIFPSLYIPENDLNAEYSDLALRKLAEWKTELEEKGISKINIEYADGNVAETISKYAVENEIDIIVMGTHGSKGLSEFFIGSNAFKLVNLVDLPVLTINNRNTYSPYKKIVAPLDDSRFSRAKFPYIAELALKIGSEVDIITPNVSDAGVNHAISICYDQVSSFLKSKNVIHHHKSIEGNLAHEVIKYAEYAKADLIVIMSETETTISQVLLGSMAQQVVNHSVVPVITLHPEDKGELMDMVVMPGT